MVIAIYRCNRRGLTRHNEEIKTMRTVKDIKDILPAIKVRVNGKVYWGAVRGRLLPFAQVFIVETGHCFEVAWKTVEHCCNNNQVLITD